MKPEPTLRKEKEATQVKSGSTSRKLEKESGARKSENESSNGSKLTKDARKRNPNEEPH
jgi:hypothetical protein